MIYDSTSTLWPVPSKLIPRATTILASTLKNTNVQDSAPAAPCPTCNLVPIPFDPTLPRLTGVF